MKLHEWLATAKTGDRARSGPDLEIYMDDHGEIRRASDNGVVELSRHYLDIDWQPIQDPLPVGEWISNEPTVSVDRLPELGSMCLRFPDRGIVAWHVDTTRHSPKFWESATDFIILPDPGAE